MDNIFGKGGKLAVIYISFMLIAGALFGILAVNAGAEPVSAAILADKISDKKEEVTTGDGGIARELVVVVTVAVDTEGEYQLTGDLSPSGINSKALVKSYLYPGENVMSLEFTGSEIFSSRIDGNYIVSLVLEYDNDVRDSKFYTTLGYYYHGDFEPVGKDLSDYTLALLSNTVRLETDALTAVIYEKTPVIEYYYTGDQTSAMFKVTYTRLIGYSDANGDGMYDTGDSAVYTADLKAANWDSNKALFENFASFDFDITTSVTMTSTQYPDVDVVLKFHYSSASYTSNAQRKFDIDIQIPDGQTFTGIDAIAIEHELVDESSTSHGFIFDEAGNTLSFVDDDGNQHGYYSWLDTADSNNNKGDIVVGASTAGSSSGMILYLSYEYDESTARIFHDPVIGVDPENIKEGIIDTIDRILHHPAVYIISVLIAAGIVFGTLFRKRK